MRGERLSPPLRRIIFGFFQHACSPQCILQLFEMGYPNMIKIGTLRNLERLFRLGSDEKIAQYLNGTPKKGGRLKILTASDESVLEKLVENDNCDSYESLKAKFIRIVGYKGSEIRS